LFDSAVGGDEVTGGDASGGDATDDPTEDRTDDGIDDGETADEPVAGTREAHPARRQTTSAARPEALMPIRRAPSPPGFRTAADTATHPASTGPM